MIDVRRCTVSELRAAANMAEVLAEYEAESSLPELGPTRPQRETYYKLEAAGVLHPIGAFDGNHIVGFILPIVVVLPHYGVFAATVESFFVQKAERSNGLGLELLNRAEALARDMGAKALLLSAPTGGALARVLCRTPRYRRSNDVFVTALA